VSELLVLRLLCAGVLNEAVNGARRGKKMRSERAEPQS
jgi:hypothetical protein